jgi:hypothetical protein
MPVCVCVRACVCVLKTKIFFSLVSIYMRLVFLIFIRGSNRCVTKNCLFVLLSVCTVFFFSYIHINIFFFYPPPDHTHKAASYLRSWCFFNFNFFSFYRKYSYDSAFLSSFPLFFLFKFLYNNNYLSSKVEKRQKEGYIYKWIYINYSKAPAR